MLKLIESNYTTKADLKEVTGNGMPNLALKSNLAKLEADVHKIDVGKLKAVHVDLSKLRM